MATIGKEKFTKHFQGREVKTTLKLKNSKCWIYDNDGNRIAGNPGDPILVYARDEYDPKYLIKLETNGKTYFVNENYVEKPSRVTSSESLGIRSETLIELGEYFTFEHNNSTHEAKSFSAPSSVIESITHGLRKNQRVPDIIIRQFEQYDGSTSFSWIDGISDGHKNELGKYVGELLPGIMLLAGNDSCFSKEIDSNIDKFVVPTESQFSGFDSFILGSEQKFISSKYGIGAAASVFSNIVPDAFDLPDCEIKYLCDSAEEIGVSKETLKSKRGSKEVLYKYGINRILNLDIENTTEIFNNVRSHILTGSCLSPKAKIVVDRVRDIAEPPVRDLLPKSLTNFFSRETARRLSSDTLSVECMKNIVAGKNYVQLNLNIASWMKGIIKFNVVNSDECSLKIIGNKGCVYDIDARHGTINFALQPMKFTA